MFHKDILGVFHNIKDNKITGRIVIIITILNAFLAFTVGPIIALLTCCCYVTGLFACHLFIRYKHKTSPLLKQFVTFYKGQITRQTTVVYSCGICDDVGCQRHQQSNKVEPWKFLLINRDLNVSLEEFYSKILDEFITSWYKNISTDLDFINELKYCLRYCSASIVKRFLEIDSAKVIANKLFPCAIKHIDDYFYMQKISKVKNARFNDIIIEYLGKRMHGATTNRKNELIYLQELTSSVLPLILPAKYLHCRNYAILMREILAGWVLLPLMDVLSDPNVINSLVIYGATYKYKYVNVKRSTRNVELLENFGSTSKQKKSLFFTDLKGIKQNTELLYAFMQFLKKEEIVNLLQFCLDVDDFHHKLLTPDLSKKELEELHIKAINLHKEYLNKNSRSYVGCSGDTVPDFMELHKDGLYNVANLRISTPLLQAYEYATSVLEDNWLEQFFHSDPFYSYLCGLKVTAKYDKALINRSKKYDITNATSKLTSGFGKIRGALKTNQPIDGSIYPPESQSMENGTLDDILPEYGIFRDLSAWRISVTSYESLNKIVHFHVGVRRLDAVSVEAKSCRTVLRKDQDFYTLKAKLVEFHGEDVICDSPLPARRAGSAIETRMAKYEAFLQNLLRKPTLRGSDLLFTFLTIEEDFSIFMSTTGVQIQDIGNIYQSVAHKLRKERGQHLDSFMSVFLSSTGKTKNGKFEWAELGDEVDSVKELEPRIASFPKTYRNHVHNDNFGIFYDNLKHTSTSSVNPSGIIECLFYLGKHVFNIPHLLLRCYVAICNVGHKAVESLCYLIIRRKLNSSLCHENLEYLIRLLQDIIFIPHKCPTKEELEARKKRAFELAHNSVTPILIKILGDEFSRGLTNSLEILQYPHYNKHLCYHLLDSILFEMYPSLNNSNKL